MSVKIVTFYKFIDVKSPQSLKARFDERCEQHQVRGLVIFAHEGVNATIAGDALGVDAVVSWLEGQVGALELKTSFAPKQPFTRHNSRVRDEIVALGLGDDVPLDPRDKVGVYVEPEAWNELIARDELVLLDMRNDYEIALGTFEGAQSPQTEAFHQLVDYLDAHNELPRDTPVAMFCTGGVRCEKASALFLARGFTQVYHLKGGILNYLERTPLERSKWRGECFVFDHRISVDHNLRPGSYARCFACWSILDPQQQQDPAYRPGLSCPRCVNDPARQARERKLKTRLAQRAALTSRADAET